MPSSLTPRERELIRREFCRRFGHATLLVEDSDPAQPCALEPESVV